MQVATDVHIRWMIRKDTPAFLRIESASFDYPWCEEDLLSELTQRNVIAQVAELDEQVVGYIVYELFKTKLEILNFAVHPDYRRQGIGTALMRKMAGKLTTGRRSRIVFHVWDHNLDAHLFLRACGFRATGIVDGFFREHNLDAYRFVLRSGEFAR